MSKINIPPAHSKNSKDLKELTFAQQASSITAMLNNLTNAIRHHIKVSNVPAKTKLKCQNQTIRFTDRIRNL